MTPRAITVDALLFLTVLCVWIGCIGMVRARHPVQALHYLSVPGATGVSLLTVAVVLQSGATLLSWKMILTAAVLFGINSVVSHATARAFRVRDTGMWQHRHGDDMELVDERKEVA